MASKQELEQAKKRLLKKIKAITPTANIVELDPNFGSYLEVKANGNKSRYLLPTNNQILIR